MESSSFTERTVQRRLFTIDANKLEKLISDKGNKTEIKARFEALKLKFEKINALNASYLQELMKTKDTTEDIIEAELSNCSEYELRFLTIKELISDFDLEKMNVSNCNEYGNKVQLRLPKIELVKFDGDLRNWIGFWGQFAKIHNDNSISLEDKFEYLRLSMKPGSPAQKLIEGFPPSKENYSKAIELLKSRYGKDEFLIEFYVRELLSLVLQKGQAMPVAQLYDRLESQLRALDSLGVTKEKYAAMLFPLVESSIPENIFKIWERHRVTKQASAKNPDDCLSELLEFLKVEVEGEERLKLRYNSFEASEIKSSIRAVNKNKMGTNVPSAAALVSSYKFRENKELRCIFCDKASHASQDCATIIDSSLEERHCAIKKKGVCFTCLKRGHLSAKCTAFVKCLICKGRHYPILCSKVSTKMKESYRNDKNETSEISMLSNSHKEKPEIYLQTLVVNVVSKNGNRRVRLLCDSGSQRSYITKKCARELDLTPMSTVYTQQELFGGRKTAVASHCTYKVVLSSLNSDFHCEVNLLDQDCICNSIPKVRDTALYKVLEKKGIYLSDFSSDMNDTSDIQILLGADAWSQIITSEIQNLSDNLVAINTQLGWTILGSPRRDDVTSSLLVSMLSAQEISKFWELETIGVTDPGEKILREEKDSRVLSFFNDTVKRDDTGRYIVKLPWTHGIPVLENNKEIVKKRLMTTTKKLHQQGKYSDYDSVLKQWHNSGIIERVYDDESEYNFYLPHRAVFRENSSTPVRPVFDASIKDRNGNSLNGSLEAGPNLIELIPTMLMKFRQYPFALSADIEKAFLQIELDTSDRDFLRFLWWEDNEIITFRHCRVVFGVTSSPFLLCAVIHHLLNNAPPHMKHIAKNLQGCFYVDNCLTGVHTEDEIQEFIENAIALMATGGFNLRKWVSNSTKDAYLVENVLGMQWYCASDMLSCNIVGFDNISPLTRRKLLSSVQKLFDPIGFTAPATIVPKILLQKTWLLKVGWDEVLPENISNSFHKWMNQVNIFSDCKIPRQMIINETSSLHIFCDASREAYGSCIFLRTEINASTKVFLIIAKSRVAPKKTLTIPRLELMATLIGVRLYTLVCKDPNLKKLKTAFWSDSTVAVTWIINEGPWSVFVQNRVKEIRRYSSVENWAHIPGASNPADILTRGCTPKQLIDSNWWEGPVWLYQPSNEWPCSDFSPDFQEVDKERNKTTVVASNLNVNDIIVQLSKRFSKFSKVVRTVAWILRFKRVLNRTQNGHQVDNITPEEFLNAEKILFRCIQIESLSELQIINAPKSVQCFKDDEGIIRLKTRVAYEDESLEYVYPIVLPSKHPLVEKMIEQQHILHNHASTFPLLILLRERVWILKGRRTVASVVNRCVVCNRHKTKALRVPFPPLPKDRTNLSSTFQVTGIDLAGPLLTKNGEKCWIVIFTCAVYRAIHLELIQSLSSGAFIQALRRFIARRGRILVIYSDNGTNFAGTCRMLKKLNWTEIQNECSLKKIVWKFIPPGAPWWGGFWERLIRTLKDLLKKNLGHASLSYEELNTLLCECEALMNNRPLTYVSDDSEELKTLKPSMFLQSLSGNDVTDLNMIEDAILGKRWNYLQNIREGLKKRFKREYLAFLNSTRKSKTDTLKIGDIVLIDNDKKRINWKLGKVLELIPGRDNITRLIRLKTEKGCQLRPIQRIFPLEIQSGNSSDPIFRSRVVEQQKPSRVFENEVLPLKTRSGRTVRPVKIFNL